MEFNPHKRKLSVLTISLNHAKFLRETIGSCFSQTFEDFEYIVIDGDSSDGTQSILAEYEKLDWISEPDGEYGFSSAFWKGLDRISGDYVIQCCVSDGFLDKDWFKDGIEFLDGNPEFSMVWGLEQRLSENGSLKEINHPEYFEIPPQEGIEGLAFWLATGITYPESNYIVRTEVIKKYWPSLQTSPKYHKIQPHLGFIFNFHCAGLKAKFYPRVVSWSRIHAEQRYERLKSIERPAAKEYLRDIKKLVFCFIKGKTTFAYRDGSIAPLVHFSCPERIRLVFSVIYQKILYSRLVIKPLYRIIIAGLDRLRGH